MSKTFAFRRPATIALALTLSLGLAACGGTPTPTVTEVTISAISGDNVLTVGETTTATVTVTGDNSPSQSVTWTSSNAGVATVDANGKITAVAVGTTTITATSTVAGYTTVVGTKTITVVAATSTTPTVTAVTVGAISSDNQLTVGETSQATATVNGTNNPPQTVTWRSSNAAVATVSATGVVTAVAPGTATITATSTVDTSKSGSVNITVVAAPVTTNPTAAFKIAFRTAGTTTGYTVNTGTGFNGTSGWVTEATANSATPTPIDMTSAARYRDPSDTANVQQGLAAQEYGTLLMDCGDVPSGNTCVTGTSQGPAAFVYKVNNGKYDVKVSVGDADKRNTNSVHVINVEGQNLVNAATPAAGTLVTATKASITVSDGLLTVDSIGGKNTKINYIEVTPSAQQ